jgi:hypothetical protein
MRVPPSQRPERQKIPETLGNWMLRHRRHWQAAHAVLTKMGETDQVLIATPSHDWEKPPEIHFLPRADAARLPLGCLEDELREPPVDDRFYCVATAKAIGTYVGMMAPEGGYLPKVTIAPWGSHVGLMVDPKTIED